MPDPTKCFQMYQSYDVESLLQTMSFSVSLAYLYFNRYLISIPLGFFFLFLQHIDSSGNVLILDWIMPVNYMVYFLQLCTPPLVHWLDHYCFQQGRIPWRNIWMGKKDFMIKSFLDLLDGGGSPTIFPYFFTETQSCREIQNKVRPRQTQTDRQTNRV